MDVGVEVKDGFGILIEGRFHQLSPILPTLPSVDT